METPTRSCAQCRHQNRSGARFCGWCGIALDTRPAPPAQIQLAPGSTLGPDGRYQIVRRLGQGGFGIAYLAGDRQLGRRCVVKQMQLDPELAPATRVALAATFRREARLLAELNDPGHPHIPEIYAYLEAEHCLVMKLIDGRSLLHVLKRRVEPLPEQEALRYAYDICSALVYLHERRPTPVIHRDIKPQNVLVDGEGRLWLIDFGLARGSAAAAALGPGAASQAMGTPGYTSPEQWQGRAEPRSDVYALGATLLELLTGRRPTQLSSQALQSQPLIT